MVLGTFIVSIREYSCLKTLVDKHCRECFACRTAIGAGRLEDAGEEFDKAIDRLASE